MEGRTLLQNLISYFNIENLEKFFRNSNDSFIASNEDYSHYQDDLNISLSIIQKVGEIEYSNSERIIVIASKTEKELTSRTGKKNQYKLAKKILKADYYDAGIFVFYDAAGHFRFSLVVASYSGTTRQFSNFRRYTYFVSPDLPNKTFLNQIGRADFSSIENILAAFSIEAVSEEFYNSFKPIFDNIALAVQGGASSHQLKEDFALLFVIRIIFLGFVQKKGWLGKKEQFLQDFWQEYQNQFSGKNKFYYDWLTPLFFEALNSPPGRKVKYQNNDFSIDTENILQMAPFLNGELFSEKDGIDTIGLWIPDSELAKFFDFLFQYNFTIEENTLYDEELELNPEFLGIIFENLVVKADGAVYTPRIEVDFMCRIALVKWLEKNSSSDKRDLYYLFFREEGYSGDYDEQQKQGDFSATQIREMVHLLQNITVCDPAAGSGAFEVGMLHVLSEILDNLLTRNNTPNDIVEKTTYEQKKDIIGNSLYGVEVKHWAVWINQLRLWLTLFIDMPDDYKNSLEPLLPSLNFKIRRGDSLVQRIGSKMFPVQEHAQLKPEIKRKITELKKLKVDFFNNIGKNTAHVRQQENLLFREILDSEIDDKKEKLNREQQVVEQIDALGYVDNKKERIVKTFEKEKEMLQKEIDELEEQKRSLKGEHPLIWNIEFAEIFFDRGGFDIIIGNPPYVRQEDISDPEGKTQPKEYKAFLQEMVRMDFPQHFIPEIKIDGKSDLYTYFYIRSLHLLNPKGMHVFICSNSWLDVGYGVWLQYFLIKNVLIKYIVDNHARRSFAKSEVNTIISVLGAPFTKSDISNIFQNDGKSLIKFIAFKKPFEESILTENLLKIENSQIITKNDIFRVFPISAKNLLNEGMEYENEQKEKLNIGDYIGDKWGSKFLRAPDIFFTVLEKGEGIFVKLKNIAEVKRGITTGANDFFYIMPLGQGSKPGLIRVQNSANWNGEIEEIFLKAVIKSPRESKSIQINPDDLKFKIFMCNKSKAELRGTFALKYIEWGEKAVIKINQGKDKGKKIIGFQELETLKNRKEWWNLGKRKKACLHFNYLVYDVGRTYIADSFAGDNFQDIFLNEEYALALNSSIFFLFQNVTGRANFGGGLMKIQTYELKNFTLLDLPCYFRFNLPSLSGLKRPTCFL